MKLGQLWRFGATWSLTFFLRGREIYWLTQTSGGLLVSCSPRALPDVLEDFRHHNCPEAAVGVVASGLGKATMKIKLGVASP